MNTCVKCGKEIPDGELFCRNCSLGDDFLSTPVEPEQAPKKKVTHDTIRLDPVVVKKPVGLIIALVVVSLIAAGLTAYIVKSRSDITKQKNQLRSTEASAQEVESQIAALESQLAAAQVDVESLEAEKQELNDQIDDLNSQLHGQTSQSNQEAYNSTAKDQEIQRLTEQNTQLSAQADEAAAQLTEAQTKLEELTKTMEEQSEANAERDEELEKLTEEVTQLEDSNTEYLKKATFMDRFVVFVENDGTNYYHYYDCPQFKKQDFWVFNPSYAKSEGYTECPYCH